ncbi:RagB/SusD family nutrient uptake outer membrane protein [Ancylomarina euxinus]|uniref:RagB/SusD family nutrient uptake outer membrane protein n=1 Tax=Ancylomarina euxinus TaxID=2283627 RepID=A0A425XZ19_9BACT|nr:RagB/SusD family nutrient uptake outer membrane protein [Ancylomarina euxinus]MCZ4695597.1 RagB/SusD family nutrient uptake outer membrane protein [Ancylomarina euxinus]MUP15978.1 RagB/SusD family nutrient uptake outer membrane protein [Ancylomarina euxinus]RRG20420.1 RagB/SusD family nutrient uptake outer membrane protein [Ancylomarina euxinus]
MKKYILILIMGVFLGACESYLDEVPSKSTNLPLETIEQLDALLGNYYYFFTDKSRNAALCTDDYEISEYLYNGFSGNSYRSMEIFQVATWDVKDTPFDGKETFWGTEYTKIFYANMVLYYLDGVSGTEEQKAELKAEANLIKAYSYWLLASNFCLPYNDATKNELGVSLKKSVSFDESAARSTLEETYAEIENCLEEALKLENSIVKDGTFRPWRGNTSAAKAFAARYYLSVNNYTKALQYANAALADYSELFDYNSEMSFYKTTTTVNNQQVEINYPSTYLSDDNEQLSYKEFYYARFSYHPYAWYVPSQTLMGLYDKDADLRYRYNFVENYSYVRDRTGISYPGYIAMGSYNIPSGPTTSEMLLIKAEAIARTGNWQDAMNVLEQLRVKRIDAGMYTELVANNQEEAVKLIIRERRLERPFVFTWYDYRRYNNNEVSYDDVNLSREFYPYNGSTVLSGEPLVTYELKKGDRKWARPIPNTEVESSLGEIKQNTY